MSEIEAKFGREVAKIVEGCTDSFEEDANKKQEWEQHTSGPIFILLLSFLGTSCVPHAHLRKWVSQIEPATTIHPIFFSKKDFHRGSRGGRECASIMSDSEFLNLLVFASLVPKMLSEGDRQMGW